MEFVFGLLDQYLTGWVAYATAAVTVFSAVAALVPTPAAGTIWAKVYKIVDVVAINVGRAKEREEDHPDAKV